MPDQRHQLGQKGEDAAVDFLKNQGQKIIHRNYRNKLGEIDIIIKDGEYICFVEVRTKTSDAQGHPFESITPKKQRKLSKIASYYLQEQDKHDVKSRFDCIAVIPQENGQFLLEYIKNAFDAIL